MRIMFVLEYGSYGGAVQMLMWVAKQMSSENDITICTICESNMIRDLAPNCNFVDLNHRMRQAKKKRSLYETICLYKAFNAVVKDFAPDLVINFGDHSFYQALLFKMFNKYKLIVSERIDPYTSRGKADKFRRFLYQFCDGAVFQTDEAKDYFPKILQRKAVVIPNPVKLSSSRGWIYEETDNSIVFVGRIDNYQKRVDILIESLAIVSRKYPNIILKVYGSGNDEDCKEIEQLVKKMNLESKVLFYGASKNVLNDIVKSKMLVFTSDFEGIPNVIIEAMSVGMPVVATDCSPGGAKLLLENGKNGLLVEKGNPKAVAEGIIYLLSNPSVSIELGVNAKKSLCRFEEKKIVDRWKHYLQGLGD